MAIADFLKLIFLVNSASTFINRYKFESKNLLCFINPATNPEASAFALKKFTFFFFPPVLV